MIVCVCRNVSDRTIRASLEAGAASARDVASRTGAGTSCGCCRGAIDALIASAPACASSPCAGCPRSRDEARREAA